MTGGLRLNKFLTDPLPSSPPPETGEIAALRHEAEQLRYTVRSAAEYADKLRAENEQLRAAVSAGGSPPLEKVVKELRYRVEALSAALAEVRYPDWPHTTVDWQTLFEDGIVDKSIAAWRTQIDVMAAELVSRNSALIAAQAENERLKAELSQLRDEVARAVYSAPPQLGAPAFPLGSQHQRVGRPLP